MVLIHPSLAGLDRGIPSLRAGGPDLLLGAVIAAVGRIVRAFVLVVGDQRSADALQPPLAAAQGPVAIALHQQTRPAP